MSSRLNNPHTQPPGGYRYRVSFTNKTFRAATMDALREQLGAHCRIHALPLPSSEEIEAQICFELGSDASQWCQDQFGMPAQADVGSPDCAGLSVASVKQGTMTLLHAVVSGRRVESTEAERRARICTSGNNGTMCPQNRDVPGCKGCAAEGLKNLVEQIRGSRTTTLDAALKVCCTCGCFLTAKVWIPLDILLAHTPAAQLERFKAKAPWCWMLETS